MTVTGLKSFTVFISNGTWHIYYKSNMAARIPPSSPPHVTTLRLSPAFVLAGPADDVVPELPVPGAVPVVVLVFGQLPLSLPPVLLGSAVVAKYVVIVT
jgi:hypothetical protein